MPLIPDEYVGHAAGLATSALWTATSLLFTAAGRRIGPTAVNATRIVMATALLAATYWLRTGTVLPELVAGQVLLLAASGLIGLSIGDQALFTAFIDIGPRLSMLIMTTAPLFAAFFGFVALGETIDAVSWLGVTLTIAGVGWVILERPRVAPGMPQPRRLRGISLAFVAAACQAGGLLLSKQGMGHGWLPPAERLDPQAATLVRVFFAGFGMIPVIFLLRIRERRLRAAGVFPQRRGAWRVGLLFTFGGAFVGPYLGIWMSLVAGDRVAIGIAQTLCSLPPVFILPFASLVYRERISLRAVIGAIVAVGGVAVLFVAESLSEILSSHFP